MVETPSDRRTRAERLFRDAGARFGAGDAAAAIRAYREAIALADAWAAPHHDLGVVLCAIGDHGEAIAALERSIVRDPSFAAAYANLAEARLRAGGGVSSVADHRVLEAVTSEYRRALAGGFANAALYVNLGECLEKLGRHEEATAIYRQAVAAGIWRRADQRPWPDYDPALSARAWWDPAELPFIADLERAFPAVRAEVDAVIEGRRYAPNVVEDIVSPGGHWSEFTLWSRGERNETNCNDAPSTARVLAAIRPLVWRWRGHVLSGEAEFLLLWPGTRLTRHCGTTNRRLTVHLGLRCPPGARIRVGDEVRSWEEGRCLVFDDSFEHEVWHDGDEVRAVLYLNVWHPELWPELTPD